MALRGCYDIVGFAVIIGVGLSSSVGIQRLFSKEPK
jgi:hypothetical protein